MLVIPFIKEMPNTTAKLTRNKIYKIVNKYKDSLYYELRVIGVTDGVTSWEPKCAIEKDWVHEQLKLGTWKAIGAAYSNAIDKHILKK